MEKNILKELQNVIQKHQVFDTYFDQEYIKAKHGEDTESADESNYESFHAYEIEGDEILVYREECVNDDISREFMFYNPKTKILRTAEEEEDDKWRDFDDEYYIMEQKQTIWLLSRLFDNSVKLETF